MIELPIFIDDSRLFEKFIESASCQKLDVFLEMAHEMKKIGETSNSKYDGHPTFENAID